MNQNDSSHPTSIILVGTNYQSMCGFPKDYRLQLNVIGDFLKPNKGFTEFDKVFCKHLIDSKSTHYQILTWFCNTIAPSISAFFGFYDDYKSIWDMFVSHYSSMDIS